MLFMMFIARVVLKLCLKSEVLGIVAVYFDEVHSALRGK
jgi:hypothetical protein